MVYSLVFLTFFNYLLISQLIWMIHQKLTKIFMKLYIYLNKYNINYINISNLINLINLFNLILHLRKKC